ncbi:MAG: hypothetical protein H7Y61_16835 [Rhizobiales bacterium]|nr:hypothetical protein [Rhizobacter sp.]
MQKALEIEKMFDQIDAGRKPREPRKADPVDPLIRTLSCSARSARVIQLDPLLRQRAVAIYHAARKNCPSRPPS